MLSFNTVAASAAGYSVQLFETGDGAMEVCPGFVYWNPSSMRPTQKVGEDMEKNIVWTQTNVIF